MTTPEIILEAYKRITEAGMTKTSYNNDEVIVTAYKCGVIVRIDIKPVNNRRD